MLDIHAAHAGVTVAEVADLVAIAVDNLAPAAVHDIVGDIEGPPCVLVARAIREHADVVGYEVVDGSLELFAALAVQGLVVTHRDVGANRLHGCRQHHHRE